MRLAKAFMLFENDSYLQIQLTVHEQASATTAAKKRQYVLRVVRSRMFALGVANLVDERGL